MSDLDNLLDATLDDLEDLPEFKPYAAGAHKVLATFESKEINGKPAVELSFKYLECLELANPDEAEPKEGDTSNTMCLLDNEYGRGNLKKLAAPFAEAMGFSSIREIVEGVKDVEVAIVTSLRKDKNNPDKVYLVVKEIQVV